MPMTSNPVAGISMPKPCRPRERRLKTGEYEALISAASESQSWFMAPLIILAVGPVRSEPPLETDGHIVFCKHEYRPVYEVLLYRKISGASRLAELSCRRKSGGSRERPRNVCGKCLMVAGAGFEPATFGL